MTETSFPKSYRRRIAKAWQFLKTIIVREVSEADNHQTIMEHILTFVIYAQRLKDIVRESVGRPCFTYVYWVLVVDLSRGQYLYYDKGCLVMQSRAVRLVCFCRRVEKHCSMRYNHHKLVRIHLANCC